MSALRLFCRVFCLWVLMLALPLQGFAAASMRFCGTAQEAPAVMAGQQQARPHDHSAHSSAHAGHRHAAPHDPAAMAAMPHAQEPFMQTTAGTTLAHDTLAHKCALCASCCHAMALPAIVHSLEFAPLPHADPTQPLVLIQAMPVRVPDKPPRA